MQRENLKGVLPVVSLLLFLGVLGYLTRDPSARVRQQSTQEERAYQEKLKAIQEQVQARVKKYGEQHEAEEAAKRKAEIRRRLELMNADLSGIWNTGVGWAYMYPNGKVTLYSRDCTVKRQATWKYEYGALTIHQRHLNRNFQISFANVIGFEGVGLTFDTGGEWIRLSKKMDERLC